MPEIKAGPLTADEVRGLWESATDKGYRAPFLKAGEGKGLEAWTQLFRQFERASKAIDVTTQAMFISPWSGQTNPPASGAAKSTVTLTFSRTKLLDRALVLGKGTTFVEEETTDQGEDGPVTVLTGRRYSLTEDLVFFPGEQGPFSASAQAERPGYGYDNPLPGTIKRMVQAGAEFENDLATVAVAPQVVNPAGTATRATLLAFNQPDMFVPSHVGQYVEFVDGLNDGVVSRATLFTSPDVSVLPIVGSKVDLELFWAIEADTFAGTFQVGETISIENASVPVAYGRVLAERVVGGKKRVAFVLLNGGSVGVSSVLVGVISAATATIRSVLQSTTFVDEAPVAGSGGASWRILGFETDWGLTASNAASPVGGKSAMLDELGSERGLGRSAGESDDSYRSRVREIGDVVTPNAVRRTLNRVFPHDWFLREVGQVTLPGFFFDGTGEPPSTTPGRELCDAWDTDVWIIVGTMTSGTFIFQEPVVFEDATTLELVGTGYFGRLDGAIYLTMIRKSGRFPEDPLVAGRRVRGLWSGAIFSVVDVQEVSTAQERAYRVWLDYEQFRAFFLVELEYLDDGEFGMGYDLEDAYDVPTEWATSYDGYPYAVGSIYGTVYQALLAIKAGGVGFELARAKFVETTPLTTEDDEVLLTEDEEVIVVEA